MGRKSLTVLVVDDEPAMRLVLETRLRSWGYEPLLAADGDEAEQLAKECDPGIVVSDVVMPGRSGLEMIQALQSGDPGRPVILITAQGTIDMAVEAMKQGAQDFLTKPIDHAKLRSVLDAAREEIELRQASQKLDARAARDSGFGALYGTSQRMKEAYELLEAVAANDAAAILTGESGTGKEVAARAIHERGTRAKGPFIALNTAAIPETLIESELFGHEKGAFTGAVTSRPGCFELAHRGTLLLDEIAEMPIALQPKLLRVLEGGRVRRLGGRQEFAFDVRVLAATNREPREAVQKGLLREDLYYRLNVFTIALPPLRERQEDIPELAQRLLREFNGKHAATVVAMRAEALDLLLRYSWPGNVRELRNVMERAVILARGEWIEPSHLPPYIRHPDPTARMVPPPGATAAETEKELILRTLEQTGNNKAEAARRLQLDVKTIRNKLKSYGLS